MTFQLPDYVLYCLNTLENCGFEAWCVGGAVRDHIMGKTPFDYDITTNATPDRIIDIFPKTVPTGLQHGTVTVVTDGGNVEITTYRADGEYTDHRSPDSVVFQNSVDADLKRRDFTMNAICYNPKKGFYDPENGIKDIENNLIRAIGDPDRRFTEDALRIMRSFRFSAQLGFAIEENTKSSAISLSALLKDISAERIYAELKRALTSKFATNIDPLLKSGALMFLGLDAKPLPENFDELAPDFAFRIAYICYKNSYDPFTLLTRLKADNSTKRKADIYLALLKMPMPKCKLDLKRMLMIGERYAVERMTDYYHKFFKPENDLSDMLFEIIENNEPYNTAMLDIDGNELIKLGIKGKDIGTTLDRLLEFVLLDPKSNVKELLLKKLQ